MICVKHLAQCGANTNQHINSFHFSNTCYMPGTVISTGGKALSPNRSISCSYEAYNLMEEVGNQLITKTNVKRRGGQEEHCALALIAEKFDSTS